MEKQLRKDLIQAMKDKSKIKKEVIQMILADFKNESIKLKRELTNEEQIDLVKKQLKQTKDAFDFGSKANRLDVMTENGKKIEIITSYLPKMLNEIEILEIIKSIPNSKDMTRGELIKEFMKDHKSESEGKIVSKIVANYLK